MPLGVEVDVEELAVPQRLRHRVGERQARHGLVGELGVDARPSRDRSSSSMKASMWPTVGRQDVAARLVGLGLEREAQVVARGRATYAQHEVDGLGVAVERGTDVLGGVGLARLRGHPRSRRSWRRARRRGRWRRGSWRTAKRRTSRVVGGEGALLEHRAARRGWWWPSAPSCPVSSSAPRNRFTIASRSAAVEPGGTRSSSWRFTPYAPSSASRSHRLDGVERRPDLVAERVAAGVADGPEPEGEAVLGRRCVAIGHAPPRVFGAGARGAGLSPLHFVR